MKNALDKIFALLAMGMLLFGIIMGVRKELRDVEKLVNFPTSQQSK